MKLQNSDIYLSKEKGLCFRVYTKLRKGESWLAYTNNIDLPEAINIVSSILSQYYEVGVFRETSFGGVLYWTSITPDYFNSSAVTIDPT